MQRKQAIFLTHMY